MKKEAILIFTENFPPRLGGSGRWFWELYTRLSDKGHQIIVLTDVLAKGENEVSETQLTIIRTPLRSREWGLKSISGLQFYYRSVLQLRKVINHYKITQVHCGRVIHEGVSAWLLSRIKNIRITCFVHGEDAETAAVSREHNLLVKQVCKSAERLICNSQNTANILTRLAYGKNTQVEILHPGVDSKRFVPAAPDQDFLLKMGWQNKFVIVTVGRLQARKGHDKMIEAMHLLKSSLPQAHYAIIGEGECKNGLQQQVEQLGLKESVQFLSEISDQDMIACYQQCDVFILPNRTIDNDIEGFGMVLVEAQACSKAVLAGDSGGTHETMLVGSTGFILDCTEPKIIADKLAQLASDQGLLDRMGKAARNHVVETLDWQAHAEKAEQIFGLKKV